MSESITTTPTSRRRSTAAFATAVLLVIGAAAGLNVAVGSLKLYLRKLPIEVDLKVSSAPAETASWKQAGVDQKMEGEMVEELGTKNFVSRTYVQKVPASGKPPVVLEMHMAYYTGMVDTVPHIPDRCLVGGGWSIAGATRVLPLNLDQEATVWQVARVPEETGNMWTARLPSTGSRVHLPRDADKIAMRVNPYTHPKQKEKLYAGYFFIANGGHCDRAEDVRLLAFRLTDSYAYYLKVQVSSQTVQSEEEFARMSGSLVGELLPDIMRCVPDWVEVLRGEYPDDNPRRASAAK